MKNFETFKEHGDVIWNIANLLRGPHRPPQYRRVMIPLTVLRRLDCVLEPTKDKVIAEHRKLKAERQSDGKPKYDAEAIEKIINQKFKLSFHNTSDFTFQKLLGDPDKLAPNLAKFISGFSPRARKIVEKFNFTDELEKLDEANRLFEVVKQIAAVDLHPHAIPNIAMGYVFEDLVRRFNEQANEEAGDHFTPVRHCIVSTRSRDNLEHHIETDADSLFAAAYAGVRDWSMLWWFSSDLVIEVRAGDTKWSVKASRAAAWYAGRFGKR